MTPRAFCSRSMIASVVTSPHPKSSASARRTSSRHAPGSSDSSGTAFTPRAPPRTRVAARRRRANVSIADVRRRLEVARGRPKSRERGRQDRPADHGLRRLLQQRLDAAHFRERFLRRLAHGKRDARPRRSTDATTSAGRRPRARCAPIPDATTTRPLRSRTAETARRAAAASKAATSIALLADGGALAAEVTVAPRLHQLEVVVAERPEERSRSARARARSRRPRADSVDSSTSRGQGRQHPAIERLGDGAARLRLHQRKAGRVQDLDREPAADLHLRRIERRVGAGPRAGGPVADAVGAVLLAAAPSA